MRYERKYRIENASPQEVRQLVKLLPASFRTAFPDRTVHNLYFDTPDFQFLDETLNGVNERRKYRIRWYNDNRSAATFETKMRSNFLGEKITSALPEMPDIFAPGWEAWTRTHLRLPVALTPALYNEYRRSYFVSMDGRFRATIDRDLHFGTPGAKKNALVTAHAVILEFKYDAPHDDDFRVMSQYVPWRLSRNSKYAEGMMLAGY